jgi:type I restriction enzyme R subunit
VSPTPARPITRAERAEGRREKNLSSYEKLRAFLDFVLGEYVRVGDEELNPEKLGSLIALEYFSAYEAEQHVGGVGKIRDAFIGFQPVLYDAGP